MSKPPDTFQNWKRGKLQGLKVMRKPPLPVNPSMISQLSKQSKPISLPKVWK
jgi:hypothetical protein